MCFTVLAQPAPECAVGKNKLYRAVAKSKRAGDYANRLMGRYDVHFYFPDLHVERYTTVIDGNATIGAHIVQATDTFCFELNKNLTIDSILYDGQQISFARQDQITFARFANLKPPGTNVLLKIFYHGDAFIPGAAAIGNGFTHNNSNVWGDTAVFSLSQPFSAYEWFPCKQFLQDKADSSWCFITTSNENLAGSNGLLEGVDTLQATQQLRFRWKSHYPIDYYLVSLAVAKYLDYTFYAHPASLPGDSVKIVNYLYRTNPATFTTIKPSLDSVALMLEYYSDLFGLYPFYREKYGHCMTPFGGGMEHQTMTSTEYAGFFTLLAHELLHHWFGNYVTCKSWKDIFLNEGFASYGEYITVEHFRGASAAKEHLMKVRELAMADTVGSVYVNDTTNVGRIFSWQLTYNKGAAVLHTLRFLLGDSLFYYGLKKYVSANAFGLADIPSFKTSLEQSSGQNLDLYFSQWIYGEGYPRFRVEYYADGKQLFLNIKHTGSAVSTPIFKTPLQVQCTGVHDTLMTLDIRQADQTFILPWQGPVNSLVIDPNNYLLQQTLSVTENQDLLFLNSPDTVVIFPNPVSDEMTIFSMASGETFAEIFDASGRRIDQFYFDKKIRRKLGHLAPGQYTLRFNRDGKILTKKITRL